MVLTASAIDPTPGSAIMTTPSAKECCAAADTETRCPAVTGQLRYALG